MIRDVNTSYKPVVGGEIQCKKLYRVPIGMYVIYNARDRFWWFWAYFSFFNTISMSLRVSHSFRFEISNGGWEVGCVWKLHWKAGQNNPPHQKLYCVVCNSIVASLLQSSDLNTNQAKYSNSFDVELEFEREDYCTQFWDDVGIGEMCVPFLHPIILVMCLYDM